MHKTINVELLLSQHHTNCPTCVRSSNCELKQVASDLNLTVDRYKNEYPEMIWTSTFPLIRDAGKCIKCMRCVQMRQDPDLKYLGCVRNRFPYNRRCFPQSGNQRIRLFSLRTVRYPLP